MKLQIVRLSTILELYSFGGGYVTVMEKAATFFIRNNQITDSGFTVYV